MTDFNIQPLGAQVKPVQQTSLADVMNIANTAQAYKQAQQINPLTLQGKQQEVEQAARMNPELYKAQQATTGTAQIGEKSAQLAFDNKQQQIALDEANSVLQDTRLKALKDSPDDPARRTSAMDAILEARDRMVRRGVNKHVAEAATAPYLIKASQGSPTLADEILNSISAGTGATSQQSQANLGLPTQQGVSTGAGIVPVVSQPSIRGSAPTMIAGPQIAGAETTIAPAGRMEDTGEKDVNNNPIFNVRDESGRVVGQTSVPTSVQQQQLPGKATSPAMPIARIPAGQSEDTGKVYQGEIIAARNAAMPAKIAVNNIDTVLKYLPLAATGKGSEAFAGLQSLVGNIAGSKPEELAAAARDVIEKNIADLVAQKNTALGGKFAASLESAQASLASAGKNPTAIIKSMDQLKPLMQHSYNYSVGLDRAIEKSPDKQYIKPKFDAAMNDAFDMNALMMKNAYDKGGNAGLAKYIKDNNLNLVNQQNLFKKLERYQSLINGEL